MVLAEPETDRVADPHTDSPCGCRGNALADGHPSADEYVRSNTYADAGSTYQHALFYAYICFFSYSVTVTDADAKLGTNVHADGNPGAGTNADAGQ